MKENSTASTSLGEIALCLSGGGYRAAAFHLGALRMLNELGLLDDVKNLSTVSGGTIVGMAFVLSRIDGEEFNDFYTRFCAFLKENDVIKLAFDEIEQTRRQTSVSKISLIRAAANIYNKKLFANRRFDELIDTVRSKKHFKDLIFNATEFRLGNAFRFRAHYYNNQNDPLKNKTIGNGKVRLKEYVARQVRLADIVAASSCFPGGFEPINLPNDFDLRNSSLPAHLFINKDGTDNVEIASVPLMDGGIYDNQGLDSMTLNIVGDEFSEDSMPPKIPYDLIIISDTNQRNDNMLDTDPPKGNPKSLLNKLKNRFARLLPFLPLIALLLLFGLIASFALLVWRYYSFAFTGTHESGEYIVHLLTYLFPILLEGALILFLLVFFYFLLNKETFLSDTVGEVKVGGENFPIGKYIGRMSFSELINFLTWRFKSVSVMASQIFMKRIRRLTVESRAILPFFNRIMAYNYIYDLNPTEPRTELETAHPELIVCARLIELSKAAEKVPTTLWFPKPDSEQQLEALIECGEASACFSILKFLAGKRKKEIGDPGTNEYRMYQKTLKIWQKLNVG